MCKKNISLLIFLFGLLNFIWAQNSFPFRLEKKTDIVLLTTGIALSGAGIYATQQQKPLEEAAILALDKNDIRPRFDRSATGYWSPSVHRASDIGLGLSGFSSATLCFRQVPKKNWFCLGVMGAETFFWTYGLTTVSKSISQRTRPFVYNSEVPLAEKLQKDARHSFFSGHTSVAAASCVFASEVYAAIHPNSKWKPLVRTGSVLLPASVAYLRYRGGKHFPTDVLVGWGLGSLVGWAVPRMHRQKIKAVSGLHVRSTGYGLALCWVY